MAREDWRIVVASGSCPCNYDADDRLNDSRAGARAIIVVSNPTAPATLGERCVAPHSRQYPSTQIR